MKKIIISIAIISAVFVLVTSFAPKKSIEKQEPVKCLISTSMGDIKVVLYDDTPLHRDNFLKLVDEKFYDGSIFHRVISQFMIQGGEAPEGKEKVTYTVPAEFLPQKYIHKKGTLCAARMPDHVNPKKASSGSQFYIVQGRPFTKEQVAQMAQRTGMVYTPEQYKIYETIGGTPHLDGAYTVFGEVYEGLDVVDKIAAVATAAADKPVEDVTMKISRIN